MRFGWIIIALCVLSSAARAQIATAPADASLSTLAQSLDQAQDQLRGLSAGLSNSALTDLEIQRRLEILPATQSVLLTALTSLAPRLRDIDARLAQLGPAPPPGAPPEPAETANARRGLQRSHIALDTEIKQARLLHVEADQLRKTLADRLQTNFQARLWARGSSVIDPWLWRAFANQLPDDLTGLATAAREEAETFKASREAGGLTRLWLPAGTLALLAAIPLSLALGSWGLRRALGPKAPSRLRRSALALWLVAVATLTPLVAGWALTAAMTAGNVMVPSFAPIVALCIRALVLAAFIESLGRALLAKRRSSWRLVPFEDDVVARLAPFPGILGAAAGVSLAVTGLTAIAGASLPASVGAECLSVLLQLVAIGTALLATVRTGRSSQSPALQIGQDIDAAPARRPWVLAVLADWAAFLGAVAAALTGYIAMAGFLMRETIWVGAVLATLSLVLRLIDDGVIALLARQNRLRGVLQDAVGLSARSLDQIAVLLSGLLRLALLVLAWLAIIAPFGAGVDGVISRITTSDVVFHFGLVTISPSAILGAVAMLLFGLVVTRSVRGWLETRYLPKTRLDVGMRASLATGVTYVGVAAAIIFVFAYLGLSLSQITLFASALSVGIGFGLQSIIGNFFSGLILLTERPVKVGDWISIGDLEGDVSKISLRATEIVMPDRSRLIVPNSDLIGKIVRNVTHSGALGCLRLRLRLAPSADPGEVRQILLARMKAHKEILGEPAPAVFLHDAPDRVLEFLAVAFLASPRQVFRVKSELLFEILPDLKLKGLALLDPDLR